MGMDSLFFDETLKTFIRFTPPVGPLMARPVATKEFPEVYFWTWINANRIDEGESPAQRWKSIENTNQDDFLLVCSHLNLVLEQRNVSGKTGKYFAYQDDLRFAFECPVLLAYQAPATTPPELPEDITVGTHGIVLTPNPVCYTIDQLGDIGQELFAHVHQGTLLLPQRESSNQSDGIRMVRLLECSCTPAEPPVPSWSFRLGHWDHLEKEGAAASHAGTQWTQAMEMGAGAHGFFAEVILLHLLQRPLLYSTWSPCGLGTRARPLSSMTCPA